MFTAEMFMWWFTEVSATKLTFLKSEKFWILEHIWPPSILDEGLEAFIISNIFAIYHSKEYKPARFRSQNDLRLKNLYLRALQKTVSHKKEYQAPGHTHLSSSTWRQAQRFLVAAAQLIS